MYEDIAISPVTAEKGDWVGFSETVDTDSNEEIEQVCRELEKFLKEMDDV